MCELLMIDAKPLIPPLHTPVSAFLYLALNTLFTPARVAPLKMFRSRYVYSSSYGNGETLKTNLMAGQPTRSKSWTDYTGLAIPPCNDYYLRKGSQSLVLPWLYQYSIVSEGDKKFLKREKKVSSIMSLHDEILAFMKYMKPTQRELEIRQDLVNRFTKLLASFNIDASAPEPVGSYVTGLFLPTSDIDMVITPRLYTSPTDVLRRIYHKLILMPAPQFHKEIRDVLRASVPLITITDAKTGIAIDLSTQVNHSKAATKAVTQWLERDAGRGDEAIIRMLVMVVKTFLTIRRCGTTYTGGINSYVLVWMVVAWVKLELPKLRSKPRGTSSSDIDSLSTALSNVRLYNELTTATQQSKASTDYGTILIAFFKFYGQEFDYTEQRIIISPEPRYAAKYSISQPYLLDIVDPADAITNMGGKAYAIKHVAESFKEASVGLQSFENQRITGGTVGDHGILGKVLGGDFLRYWMDRLKLER
ncbi:hypothetical protein BJ165DRAFT_1517602 [Panaeolus papilionaceus]|nr:hypothetical protein BJ165DRAFT_1517602 [Panaeolus papilionaceus]